MHKLLKKLTLFDKLIILLAGLGIIVFAYVFFRKTSYINVTLRIDEDDVRYVQWSIEEQGSRTWYSQLFHQGMTEKDGFGKINAEVESVYSYDLSPGKQAIYLTVKLNGVYSRSQNQYTYKGNPVSIGYPIKLFLDNVYVKGIVTSVENVIDPRERVTLQIEAKVVDDDPKFMETTGVPEYEAEAINKGDTVLDNAGNIVIKVSDKKTQFAKKTVTTSDGRVVTALQPNKYDVYLTLEINAVKISGNYFIFDDVPILIGEEIPLNTSTYSFRPQVTKISEK